MSDFNLTRLKDLVLSSRSIEAKDLEQMPTAYSANLRNSEKTGKIWNPENPESRKNPEFGKPGHSRPT